jgi:hypothetical protein
MEYINFFFEKYKNNIFSQNGEDGVIEEILNRLDVSEGWCCEFGAWDGKHLSNTFNLVQKGFNAVYIEGDENKFKDLIETSKIYTNIIPINKWVDLNQNKLDAILKSTGIPKDFTLLSIDIDSSDYHVWESLEEYNPIIVVIEINSSISPFDENWIQQDGTEYETTSFLPMYKLGLSKGYTFLLHTGNMFFIRNDYFKKLLIEQPEHYLHNFRRNWLYNEL